MEWDYEPTGNAWLTASVNEQRADWAEAAVAEFRYFCRGDNDISAIYDLIGNLGHLYDRIAAEYDLSDDLMLQDGQTSFERLIELGLMHYHAERGEGDDIEQAFNRNDPED